ncbi:MAG: HD domain-containing protein [bacterium]|nr:HD domain-containing protein [bacterium]MDD5756267.1 HD domain-containing protein [bacterium]
MSSLFYNFIIVIGIITASYIIFRHLWEKESTEENDRILSQLDEARKKIQSYSTELNDLLGLMSSFHRVNTAPTTLNMDEVAWLALDNALKILGAIKGSLFVINKRTNQLELKAAIGYEMNNLPGANLSVAQIENGAHQKESFPSTPSKKGSFISVPLKIQNRIIGIINVNEKNDDRQFAPDDLKILTALADQTAIVLENLTLYKDLQQVYLGVIKTLSLVVDAKDHYTFGHSERVTKYVVEMATEMKLSLELKKLAEAASIIHDIGKIGIKEEILLKTGRLTDSEFEEIKKHPVIGRDMVRPMEFLSELAPLVYYHHQHFNGGGYPDKAKGDQIPLVARMITIADSFDAMVSDRPYRNGLPVETAIKELKRCSGTQFDPDLVTVFLKVLRRNLKMA